MEQSVKSITDIFAEHSIYILRYTKNINTENGMDKYLYHDGAQSYYAARGFGGSLRL